MMRYIMIADRVSAWFGKAFAWTIIVMTFGTAYEVFVRYILNDPTAWAFDVSYVMYGTLFMMGGAYTLSRDGHVRGDFVYRLWKPRTQAKVELVLYMIFFFPGVTALVLAGWKYAARSWRFLEVSVSSPADVPVFQFKTIMVAAAILLFFQGIAQVMRCIVCLRTGKWMRPAEDVEEIEARLLKEHELEMLRHGTEAVDVLTDRRAEPEERRER
ncbi:MAG: TRAP transporter small permease subunit [Hyphomicrobiales bacterium]|nr:TRAP transporter small permease subunit [Hyphomicrobiales bacterium]